MVSPEKPELTELTVMEIARLHMTNETAQKLFPVQTNDKGKETYTCSMSGVEVIVGEFMNSDQMTERRLCYECNWIVNNYLGKYTSATIIDYSIYTPGARTRGSFRGMAGRRFDIEYFAGPNTGKQITCKDLWFGCTVPLRWRPYVVNTARFRSGGQEMARDIKCWNPSDSKEEEWTSVAKAKLVNSYENIFYNANFNVTPKNKRK